MKILGITATPIREDGYAMRNLYESVSAVISYRFLMEQGYLAEPVGMVFGVPVDISGVGVSGGDFNEGQLGTILNAANVNEIIYAKWKENADGLPTIVFCTTKAHAHALASVFESGGETVAVITSETQRKERAGIIERYRNGETTVLVNVMIFVEGIDLPLTRCIVMARPTLSVSLYQQAVGRGGRIADGKTSFLVLDFHPKGDKELACLGDILGEIPEAELEDAGVTRDKVILEGGIQEAKEAIELESIKATAVAAMRLHLFGQMAPITGRWDRLKRP